MAALTVALEDCGAGAHDGARELMQLGHEVRLIPPAYVKPFVTRHKNDDDLRIELLERRA